MTAIPANRRPATTLTTADVLAMVARLTFQPIDNLPPNARMELMDSSPDALVAVDPTYLAPNPGARRVVVLDGAQATIDVIDFYAAPDAVLDASGGLLTYPQDPAIRISLGVPVVCD